MTKAILMVILIIVLETSPALAVVPSRIGGHGESYTRLQLITNYFYCGFTYSEIIVLLLVMDCVKLSLTQLKRILRANNLRRKIDHILGELKNSGQCIGYRSMWRRLVEDHHLHDTRDSVLRIMRLLDPEGVRMRKAHRLIRRKYCAKGPNYVWHVDGYDKLKPYGFCIHGAIDGYSRRILWLEVSSSNNDPSVIATYFLETLKHTGFTARLIRCDRGTENSTLALLQPFFRFQDRDAFSGLKSFVYGRSVFNQRIEAWWGTLRRQGVQWWICFFKDLRDSSLFDETNPFHAECLKYCFMNLIQTELDRIAQHWNLHTIRSQKNSDIPNGKPELMYFVPEMFGGQDFGYQVDQEDVITCLEMFASPRRMYSDEFKELSYLLLPNHTEPADADAGLNLYRELISHYEEYI